MSEHMEFGRPYEEVIISGPVPVRSEQIPDGYSMFERKVRLLSGALESAYYSTHIDQSADPNALDEVREALCAGFIWVLQISEFYDHETADDDRSQEIGNMMSYGISQGLTEDQIVSCYREAFLLAQN